jgi:hypothetical protein
MNSNTVQGTQILLGVLNKIGHCDAINCQSNLLCTVDPMLNRCLQHFHFIRSCLLVLPYFSPAENGGGPTEEGNINAR